MPAPTPQDRQAALATALATAVAAFDGVCVCCGSTDENALMFVVETARGLKALTPTAGLLDALVRHPPSNATLRCGNCYAVFNNTGVCSH